MIPIRDRQAFEALLAALRRTGWRRTPDFWRLERAALRLRPSDSLVSDGTAVPPPWIGSDPWRRSRWLVARTRRLELNKLAGLPEEA